MLATPTLRRGALNVQETVDGRAGTLAMARDRWRRDKAVECRRQQIISAGR
jgi:hypothetical protein